MTFTTDEQLYKLLSEIESWKAGLPEQLQFRGVSSSRSAGSFIYTTLIGLADQVNRHIAYIILLRLHAVLACVYADQLFMSFTSQIWVDCRQVDRAHRVDESVH